MKFQLEIEINAPRSTVIELFDNVENMSKWQKELVSFEHVSGVPGEKGAVSKLIYLMGKRKVEMIETITENNLPIHMHGTYQAKGVLNKIENYFDELDQNTTLWRSDNEYKLSGVMKIIGFMFPSSFEKQSYKLMEDFKSFVETNS